MFLRAPPPLERPLRVERSDDGGATIFDADTLVAEAHPAELVVEPPPAVSAEQASAARAAERWTENHPFPTCFGCGPERAPRDGLRLFVGPVEGSDLFACPFTADASVADGEALAPEMVWAVLDCPSAGPASNPGNSPPIVLASMAVTQSAPVHVAEPHVIVSQLEREDGRKRFTSVALYSEEGELKATGRSLWISLRADG